MKAILILEMPEKCDGCPLYRDSICIGTLENSYGVWGCYVVLPDEDEKPYWCPLKEMPEKRILPRIEVENTNYGEEPWFSDGWNACLEEIEK